MTLREQIDGARLVMAHNDTELTLVWYGSGGIHVYADDGTAVDFFTLSVDLTADGADPDDVEVAMYDYMAETDDDDVE